MSLRVALGVSAAPGRLAAARVAAHRGGAQLGPENSLGAFRDAVALGVDYVEADVHRAADGGVVVLHDATLDRTTTGRGAVRTATRASLGSLRLRDPMGTATDEAVPSLDELLSLLAASGAGLLLEIKVDERGKRYPGIEEEVITLLRGRHLVPRTVVMAFEPDTVARVRELDPALRTVLLVGFPLARRRQAAAGVQRAAALGTWGIGLQHRLVDAEVVAAGQRAGLVLAAWTVNEVADLRRLIGLGADILISDRPALALRELGR